MVLSSTGHVLQEFPLVSHQDGQLLRGQVVYLQEGRTLTRYDSRRKRTTGRWVVGRRSDVVGLLDIRNGFAVYQLNGELTGKFILLRLRDRRQASVPIPQSPDYKFKDVGSQPSPLVACITSTTSNTRRSLTSLTAQSSDSSQRHSSKNYSRAARRNPSERAWGHEQEPRVLALRAQQKRGAIKPRIASVTPTGCRVPSPAF